MIIIYQILCTKTNRVYIGQTSNFSRRLRNHKSNLNLNKHYNPKLQEDWNKYGQQYFIFTKLEQGDYNSYQAIQREDYWHDFFNSDSDFEVINGVKPSVYNEKTHITAEMIEDMRNGITQRDWKTKYGVSEGTLKRLKKEYGLAGPPKHEVIITDEMLHDAMNEISKKEWLMKYSCSVHILKKIRKVHKIPKVPNSKPIRSTDEMIEDIRSGITQREWVIKYPYSIGVLKRIKKELKEKAE